MAYNNGFPINYGYQVASQVPQPVPPQMVQPQPSQPVNSNLIWVQGEAGAKSYLVAPNNTLTLWDSEAQTIYLKSADASGMPSMKILDYTIRDNQIAKVPLKEKADEYVTKDELDSFKHEVKEMIKKELDA